MAAKSRVGRANLFLDSKANSLERIPFPAGVVFKLKRACASLEALQQLHAATFASGKILYSEGHALRNATSFAQIQPTTIVSWKLQVFNMRPKKQKATT